MTHLYAVIGTPIAHSKSPLIHQAFAEQTGQDLEYVRIEGTAGQFARDVDAFRARGGRGLNVTTPFKRDAFAYATALGEGAAQAGAVNCLGFEGPTALGANFDGIGLLRDIEHNLAMPLAGRRVLLLGAGGAARGAIGPLLAARPSEIVLANRTLARAEEVAALFPGEATLRTAALQQLGAERFDVIINATSAGMVGARLDLPPNLFQGCRLAYDMVYGRGLTQFLKLAQAEDARQLADGVGMLVEQAAEAFAMWRGIRPATGRVIERLAIPLV